MSDARISDLTALSAVPANDDLLVIVDVSDTTDASSGTTKKITAGQAFGIDTKETPSGAFNGSNVTYTLAHTPLASTVDLTLMGQVLVEGVDYTISGLTITMTTAIDAGYTGSFIAKYRYKT
jgi:hypothetical protein